MEIQNLGSAPAGGGRSCFVPNCRQANSTTQKVRLLSLSLPRQNMTESKQQIIDRLVRSHELWVASKGKEGERLNLFDEDFSGVNLSRRDLRYSIIVNCKFDNVNFYETDLSYVIFHDNQMFNCSFTKARLIRASLTKNAFNGSVFHLANFYAANFAESCLIDADLTKIFYFTPYQIFQCNWADLSRPLSRQLVLLDSYNHPKPLKFFRWFLHF